MQRGYHSDTKGRFERPSNFYVNIVMYSSVRQFAKYTQAVTSSCGCSPYIEYTLYVSILSIVKRHWLYIYGCCCVDNVVCAEDNNAVNSGRFHLFWLSICSFQFNRSLLIVNVMIIVPMQSLGSSGAYIKSCIDLTEF